MTDEGAPLTSDAANESEAVCVNADGVVFVDGVKAPFRCIDGKITFVDKAPWRSEARGSRIVETSFSALARAVDRQKGPNNGRPS